MAPNDKICHVPTDTGGSSARTSEAAGVDVAAQGPQSGDRQATELPPVIQWLPVGQRVGEPATVQFTISDDLPRWDRAGRVHEALLRVRVTEATELDLRNLIGNNYHRGFVDADLGRYENVAQ